MELFTIGKDKRKHYNWPLIYEDQKTSGLNICRYCRENEITESAFYITESITLSDPDHRKAVHSSLSESRMTEKTIIGYPAVQMF